eukprot:7225656-Alexandrium_andersonii.AAC.1
MPRPRLVGRPPGGEYTEKDYPEPAGYAAQVRSTCDRVRHPGRGPLRHPELFPGTPRGRRPRRQQLAVPAS